MELWNRLMSAMEKQMVSKAGRERFRYLKRKNPALNGFDSVENTLAFQRNRKNKDYARRDAVLFGLIREAGEHGGFDEFARAFLFLCLGDVLRCSCKHYRRYFTSDNEAVSEFFAVFLDEIEGWPRDRQSRIAATFTLNIRRKIKSRLDDALREKIRLRGLLGTSSSKTIHETPTMNDFWSQMESPLDPLPNELETLEHLIGRCRMSEINARLCVEKALNKRNLREAAEIVGVSHAAARHRWQTIMKQLNRNFSK